MISPITSHISGGKWTFCSWVWNLDLDTVEGRVSQPPLNIQPRVLSPLRNFHGASSLLAELLTGAKQGHPSRSGAGLIKGLPDSTGAQQSSSPAVIKSWSMFHYSFIYWWLSSSLPRLLLPSTSRHSIRDSVSEIAPATGLLAHSTTKVQSPAGHLEGPEAQLHQPVWWEREEDKAWPQGEAGIILAFSVCSDSPLLLWCRLLCILRQWLKWLCRVVS